MQDHYEYHADQAWLAQQALEELRVGLPSLASKRVNPLIISDYLERKSQQVDDCHMQEVRSAVFAAYADDYDEEEVAGFLSDVLSDHFGALIARNESAMDEPPYDMWS